MPKNKHALHALARKNHQLLWNAIQYNQVGLVKSLLLSGASTYSLETQKIYLLLAAQYGNIDIAKLLLKRSDTRVNQTNEHGVSASLVAAYNNDVAFLKLLLSHPGLRINQADEDGATPLFVAAQYGNTAAVQLLLSQPAVQINKCDENGTTPLLVAIKNRHRDIVALLLQHPKIQVNRSDKSDITPLSCSAQYNDTYTMSLLLQHPKIHINQSNKRGASSLFIAAYRGSIDAVHLLLQHPKTNIHQSVNYGASPLFIATQCGHLEIATMLLAAGADERTACAYTPLEIAKLQKNEAMIEVLLSARATAKSPKISSHATVLQMMRRFKYQGGYSMGLCNGIAYTAACALLTEKPNFFYFDHYLSKIAELAEDPEQSLDLDSQALLDAIELYQESHLHAHLFSSSSIIQNTDCVHPLLMPIDLEKGRGLVKLSNLSCVYREKGLTTCLEMLQRSIEKYANRQPISIILKNSKHSICLGFNPKKAKRKRWSFIDSNQLPRQFFKTPKEIAKKVISTLSGTAVAVLSMEIYGVKSGESALTAAITDWKNTDRWQTIHKVSAKKAALLDSDNTSWLCAAILCHDYEKVSELLLQPTTSINQPSSNGYTALFLAAQYGSTDIAKLLLAQPTIDLNQATLNGLTPLWVAAKYGHLAVVKLLLAQPNIKIACVPNNGLNPLKIAEERGHHQVVQALLEAQEKEGSINIKSPLKRQADPDETSGALLPLFKQAKMPEQPTNIPAESDTPTIKPK